MHDTIALHELLEMGYGCLLGGWNRLLSATVEKGCLRIPERIAMPDGTFVE